MDLNDNSITLVDTDNKPLIYIYCKVTSNRQHY